MFVRNNTICPSCGKSRTFDVFIEDLNLAADSVVVAECFHCLAQYKGSVSGPYLRYVLRAIAQQCPKCPGSDLSSRWRSDHVYLSLSVGQQDAVARVVARALERGVIHDGLLEGSILSLQSMIGWLHGDLLSTKRFLQFEDLTRDVAPGQPLAS